MPFVNKTPSNAIRMGCTSGQKPYYFWDDWKIILPYLSNILRLLMKFDFISFHILAWFVWMTIASNIERYNRKLDSDSLKNYTIPHYLNNNNGSNRDILNNAISLRTDDTRDFDPHSSAVVASIEQNQISKCNRTNKYVVFAIIAIHLFDQYDESMNAFIWLLMRL